MAFGASSLSGSLYVPQKSSTKGHIHYSTSALSEVNYSGREMCSSQHDSWRDLIPNCLFKSHVSKKLLKRVGDYKWRQRHWVGVPDFPWLTWHKGWKTPWGDSISPSIKKKKKIGPCSFPVVLHMIQMRFKISREMQMSSLQTMSGFCLNLLYRVSQIPHLWKHLIKLQKKWSEV